MTLEQLKAERDKLKGIRSSGLSSVAYDGDEVAYRTDAQLASAIASLEADIANLERGPRSRSFTPRTSRGI